MASQPSERPHPGRGLRVETQLSKPFQSQNISKIKCRKRSISGPSRRRKEAARRPRAPKRAAASEAKASTEDATTFIHHYYNQIYIYIS